MNKPDRLIQLIFRDDFRGSGKRVLVNIRSDEAQPSHTMPCIQKSEESVARAGNKTWFRTA